jgi:hypothetical protein
MNVKWAIAIVAFLIALFLIYKTFFNIKLNLEKGKEISVSQLQSNIIEKPLCIIANISRENSDVLNKNVIDCALSYFQTASLALPKKRIDYYGFQDDKCMALIKDQCKTFPCEGRNVDTTVEECIKKIEEAKCYYIVVNKGDPSLSQSYEKGLFVFIDQGTYNENSCKITIKSS